MIEPKCKHWKKLPNTIKKLSRAKNVHDSCPADWAICFCNSVLSDVAHKDHVWLKKYFSDTIKKHLQMLFSGAEVFWAPARDKATYEELTEKIILSADVQNTQSGSSEIKSYSNFINSLLIQLHLRSHSGTFLRYLSTYTDVAESRIFEFSRASKDTDDIEMKILHAKTLEENYQGYQKDIRFIFDAPDVNNIENLYLKYGGKWQSPECNQAMYDAMEEVQREYLDLWQINRSEFLYFLKGHWINNENKREPVTEQQKHDLINEADKALKQFAVMFLFMKHNGMNHVSYYLSQVLKGQPSSSMVIYWKAEPPDHAFHCLLSMLLGLNASPVLQARAQHELKQVAFRNSGHVLKNRCNSISGYLKEVGLDSVIKDKWSKFKSAQNLSDKLVDLFDTLWLWSYDNFSMLIDDLEGEPAKKERYLADNECDLVKIVNSLCEITAESKFIEGVQRVLSLYIQIPEGFSCTLTPELSVRANDKYRLSDMVLEVIFYEMTLNAIRHGYINKKNPPDVTLNVTSCNIEGHECMLLWNAVDTQAQETKDKYNELPDGWQLIHQEKMKGLGIAAKLLDNLKIGKIWHRRVEIDGHDCYLVALHLKGMHVHNPIEED